MKMGDDEMLTIKQAAERIGVAPGTLSIQARTGRLKATLLGHTYVVRASDLAEYDEQRKVRGVARPDHPLYGKRGGGGRRRKE